MKKNQTNGITLIALVITIIVLLILTGITILSLTGENGILHKAISAKEKSKEEEINERIQLIRSSIIMEDFEHSLTFEDFLNRFFDELVRERLIENKSENIFPSPPADRV